MVDILVDEMTMTMRLLGTPAIKDLDESKVRSLRAGSTNRDKSSTSLIDERF